MTRSYLRRAGRAATLAGVVALAVPAAAAAEPVCPGPTAPPESGAAPHTESRRSPSGPIRWKVLRSTPNAIEIRRSASRMPSSISAGG